MNGCGPIKQLARRDFLRASLASAGALLLSSCGQDTRSRKSAYDINRDYASEPFPVLRVKRSKFSEEMLPTLVRSPFNLSPGTIIVKTQQNHIYLVEQGGIARRYGVAVGAAGYAWSGAANVGRKSKWPAWHPTANMHAKASLPARIAPGPHNPLGARALYLFQNGRDTLYRIHGTSEPWTIGTSASSGCVRMFNEDIIDLYDRVKIGAKVIVS